MQTHRCQGIILQTLSFRDYDQILTVFSKEYGLLKFIAKNSHAAKRGLKCAPFIRGEFIFVKNAGELYSLRDLSIVSQHLHLRTNLACLTAACTCSKALLDTQLLQKPSEDLYTLFIAYLDQFPLSSAPLLLESSFLLKLLRHEGIFEDLPATSEQEAETIHTLAYARSFAEMCQLSLSPSLYTRIKKHFHASFQNSP